MPFPTDSETPDTTDQNNTSTPGVSEDPFSPAEDTTSPGDTAAAGNTTDEQSDDEFLSAFETALSADEPASTPAVEQPKAEETEPDKPEEGSEDKEGKESDEDKPAEESTEISEKDIQSLPVGKFREKLEKAHNLIKTAGGQDAVQTFAEIVTIAEDPDADPAQVGPSISTAFQKLLPAKAYDRLVSHEFWGMFDKAGVELKAGGKPELYDVLLSDQTAVDGFVQTAYPGLTKEMLDRAVEFAKAEEIFNDDADDTHAIARKALADDPEYQEFQQWKEGKDAPAADDKTPKAIDKQPQQQQQLSPEVIEAGKKFNTHLFDSLSATVSTLIAPFKWDPEQAKAPEEKSAISSALRVVNLESENFLRYDPEAQKTMRAIENFVQNGDMARAERKLGDLSERVRTHMAKVLPGQAEVVRITREYLQLKGKQLTDAPRDANPGSSLNAGNRTPTEDLDPYSEEFDQTFANAMSI